MVLKLYKMDGSAASRSAFMTVQALNIHVEYIDVDLLKGDQMTEEYTKINPQHTVPMLKDGDFYVVWDSHAIAVYLITKYGQDDSLYPADPCKRALINQRLYFDSGVLIPAYMGAVAPIFWGGEKKLRPENLEKVKNAYYFAEKFLTSDWMAGDDVTLADLCCVATVSSMEAALPIDKQEYPNLSAWLQRCSQQEFYKKGNAPGLGTYKILFKLQME